MPTIACEVVGEVLLPAIGLQAFDLKPSFSFRKALQFQETCEDFILLCDRACLGMPSEVIEEGYEVTTSIETHILCQTPHIRMD